MGVIDLQRDYNNRTSEIIYTLWIASQKRGTVLLDRQFLSFRRFPVTFLRFTHREHFCGFRWKYEKSVHIPRFNLPNFDQFFWNQNREQWRQNCECQRVTERQTWNRLIYNYDMKISTNLVWLSSCLGGVSDRPVLFSDNPLLIPTLT